MSNNENTKNNNNSIVIIVIINYIDIIIINISIDVIREILSHLISLYFSPTISLSHELPLVARYLLQHLPETTIKRK
jgi:hypothetical protein